MKITKLAVDEKKATEGIWMDGGEGLELRIARQGNSKFEECARELLKPHLNRLRRDALPIEKQRELNVKAIARTILLDWKNLQDEDGKDIPYSRAKAEELLLKHRDFERLVMDLAGDLSAFKAETLEDSLGNSQSA